MKYLIVDNDFNWAHYKYMIGKTVDEPIPYAAVKPVYERVDYLIKVSHNSRPNNLMGVKIS